MDTVTATDDRASHALFELLRSDQITARYPEVRQLIAAVSVEDRQRAGRILSRLNTEDIGRAHPSMPAITVAVTGTGTLSPLLPSLTGEMARHGILLKPYLSNFGTFAFELSDPESSLYAAGPDLVLCALDASLIFDDVPTPWEVADVVRALDEKLRLLDGLADIFEATCRGALVFNTLPLLRHFVAQRVDYRSRASLGAEWRAANARLLRLTETHPSVVVLDLDPIAADGVAVSDARLSAYTKAHFSAAMVREYAREAGHLARHLVGGGKKVLALDLDNTLWGGVLGDDGVDGIQIGNGYRGEAFASFQQVVKQLGSQGVLLAAVSKNDRRLVREAFSEHPDMVLRESDLVKILANWRPKPENLLELADVLNLGVDSFVFVDDNPFECELVNRQVPGVATIQLDDEPALHIEKVLRDGWFNTLELTAEDRSRPAKYREDGERMDFLRTFTSVEDYLRDLDLRVVLEVAADQDVARISQLTLRTNQFNLTQARLQHEDVRVLLAAPDRWVLAIRSRDRFGDNGLVGVIFARHDGEAAWLENFLLSCRVFSRGIEQACLSAVLEKLRSMGCESIFGYFRPSSKNAIVADLYPQNGFRPVGSDNGMSVYLHTSQDIIEVPRHIRLTTRFDRPPAP